MSDQKRPDEPGQGNATKTEVKGRPDDARTAAKKDQAKTPVDVDMDLDMDMDAVDIGADPSAVLAAEVETLQAQIADLTDRPLRAHADLDNVRKRGEREKQETARYAISSFAKDTVGLVDNFERAMQAVEPEAIEKDPHLKALLDGVAMTEREFINVLERHGVRRVSPKGQPFDPRLHQAVMERQDPSVPNGTVVECFQPGYTIKDRCLRPAMVVVARGGGKAQAEPGQAGTAEKTAADKQSAASELHDKRDRGAEAGPADPATAQAKREKGAPSSDNDNPTT